MKLIELIMPAEGATELLVENPRFGQPSKISPERAVGELYDELVKEYNQGKPIGPEFLRDCSRIILYAEVDGDNVRWNGAYTNSTQPKLTLDRLRELAGKRGITVNAIEPDEAVRRARGDSP